MVLSLPALAQAQEGRAVGRFGIVTAGRINLGELGDSYQSGLLLGLHAGIDQPLNRDSRWTIGLGWTAFVRGYYFASRSSLVDKTIDLTEVDFGFRVRRRFGRSGHYLVSTLGAVFSASDVPLPPTDERRYLGAYGGLGYEQPAFGEWSFAADARFSTLVDGPQSLSFLFGLTAGI
jgi:hypothetical protein